MEQPGQAEFRFADRTLLAELTALLPPYAVMVRHGVNGVAMPYVRTLAASLIERALCEGWTIDRTNGDGPLAQWNGWLIIESPEKLFLQIAGPSGKELT